MSERRSGKLSRDMQTSSKPETDNRTLRNSVITRVVKSDVQHQENFAGGVGSGGLFSPQASYLLQSASQVDENKRIPDDSSSQVGVRLECQISDVTSRADEAPDLDILET